jgi:predicted ATPase
MENNHSSKKFKFCYVMRGAPGSGKTTVANELAGEGGVIFSLEKNQASPNGNEE